MEILIKKTNKPILYCSVARTDSFHIGFISGYQFFWDTFWDSTKTSKSGGLFVLFLVKRPAQRGDLTFLPLSRPDATSSASDYGSDYILGFRNMAAPVWGVLPAPLICPVFAVWTHSYLVQLHTCDAPLCNPLLCKMESLTGTSGVCLTADQYLYQCDRLYWNIH